MEASGEEQRIRILLVDDHSLFRSGIRSLLQRHPEFDIVGEAGDGMEGVKRAAQLKPDVVLLDLHMPGLSGREAAQLISRETPLATSALAIRLSTIACPSTISITMMKAVSGACVEAARKPAMPRATSVGACGYDSSSATSWPSVPPIASAGAKMPPGAPDQALSQVATNLPTT